MALLLYPTLADGMVALVRFCRVDLAGREGEEAWSGLVSWLTPAGDAGPPEITELATGAGHCRRIRRRFTAGAGGEGPAGEHLGTHGRCPAMASAWSLSPASPTWRPPTGGGPPWTSWPAPWRLVPRHSTRRVRLVPPRYLMSSQARRPTRLSRSRGCESLSWPWGRMPRCERPTGADVERRAGHRDPAPGAAVEADYIALAVAGTAGPRARDGAWASAHASARPSTAVPGRRAAPARVKVFQLPLIQRNATCTVLAPLLSAEKPACCAEGDSTTRTSTALMAGVTQTDMSTGRWTAGVDPWRARKR
jgi:hypothetical protein